MRRGPPPLPTAVKVQRGTFRPHRARGEPVATPGMPSAPDWLSADAKKEWNRLLPRLAERGLVEVVDRSTLVAYVTAWAELVDAERRLAEEGSTVVTARGGLQLSPQVKRAQVARQQLLRAAAEFGLSPSARTRVQASPVRAAADPDSPAARFFGHVPRVGGRP
jgi:P27 family predicted phage terminase small subunit